MTLLTCAAVRRRLQAFYDRELAVGEMIAVESHVHDCPPCARDLREVQNVGEALRLAAAPGPSDDWTGLRSGVISRMRAEAHESWDGAGPARARRHAPGVDRPCGDGRRVRLRRHGVVDAALCVAGAEQLARGDDCRAGRPRPGRI